MNRPLEAFTAAVSAIRGRLLVVAGQSERTLVLGAVLLVSALSVVRGFVLARYFSVDVLSTVVIHVPEDCLLDWPAQVGRHCFSDYSLVLSYGMRPDPWEPFPLPHFKSAHNNYSAAAMLPHMFFGYLGNWLHAPKRGLVGYLLALTTASFTPAVWAARGARGLERVVVFMALGVAAIPAWAVIDRGNSVGFVVPIALVFLVALCRRRWGLVAVMVVLASLVKPQFVVLVVALFAARQWRWGGFAVAGAVITNLAAYLVWPRNFPITILQSIHEALGFGSSSSASSADVFNMSFAEGLLIIPDDMKAGEAGGKIPADFVAGPRSLLGYVVLVLAVVCVVALGRRISPVMAGIVLLATASLFPSLVPSYYLVFVLPVAALVARDPDGSPGSGIFDRPETLGGRRRAVGLCVSLAAVLSIAQTVPIGPPLWNQNMGAEALVGHIVAVITSVRMAPVLWLIACMAIIVSYACKPTPPSHGSKQWANPDGSRDVAANNSLRRMAVPTTES